MCSLTLNCERWRTWKFSSRMVNGRHTHRGGRATTHLLRWVLRRVLETAFKKVVRRVWQWILEGGRVPRRVLRRGKKIKQGLLRRHLEGRNTPFQEHNPLRVRPKHSEPTQVRINFWPHPQPQNSLLRISVCNQVSNGNSYWGEPTWSWQNLLPLQFPVLSPLVRRIRFP